MATRQGIPSHSRRSMWSYFTWAKVSSPFNSFKPFIDCWFDHPNLFDRSGGVHVKNLGSLSTRQLITVRQAMTRSVPTEKSWQRPRRTVLNETALLTGQNTWPTGTYQERELWTGFSRASYKCFKTKRWGIEQQLRFWNQSKSLE